MSGSRVHTIEGDSKFKAKDQSVSREFCQSLHCFGKRCFNGGDLTDKMFAAGRESLARDINLIRIIRSLRFLESFAEDRMDKREFYNLRVEAQKREIEQDFD